MVKHSDPASVLVNRPNEMDRIHRSHHKHNLTAPVIVDIQCFKDDQNEFILKEVCVLEADTGVLLMHHVAKPPYERTDLSDEKLRESYWLTKHCHGLTWEHGDIPYHALLYKLTTCISKRPTVYVKGLEKKEYLKRQHIRDFVTTNVIDVCDIGCGSLASINNLMSTNILRCCNHNSTHTRCALTNCVAIRGWLYLTTKIDEDENNSGSDDSCFCSCFRTITTSSTAATIGYDTVE